MVATRKRKNTSFDISLCLTLMVCFSPGGFADPTPTPTPVLEELDTWNWNGGDWMELVDGCPVAPSDGLYTCIGGPLWVGVELQDVDGWNNQGEHYHGDDDLKEIILCQYPSGTNPGFIWGSTTDISANRQKDGSDGSVVTWYGEVECTAPTVSDTYDVFVRGVDVPKWGDDRDTSCVGSPGDAIHERGCEFCEDSFEIPVFKVEIEVRNKVSVLEHTLCSDSLAENGNDAEVHVRVVPSFPTSKDIEIKLKVNSYYAGLGVLGSPEATITQSLCEDGYPVTMIAEPDRSGWYVVEAYYEVDGTEYLCSTEPAYGPIFTLDAEVHNTNNILESMQRTELEAAYHTHAPPDYNHRGEKITDYYYWTADESCKGGGENCEYDYNAQGSTDLFGQTLGTAAWPDLSGLLHPRNTGEAMGSGNDWAGRNEMAGKLRVVTVPQSPDIPQFQVTLGGDVVINDVYLEVDARTTHEQEVTMDLAVPLADWLSFGTQVWGAGGEARAGAYVKVEIDGLEPVTRAPIAFITDDRTPQYQYNPTPISLDMAKHLGAYYDVGNVNGSGKDITLLAGASAVRQCIHGFASAKVSTGSFEIVPTKYRIVSSQ